MISDRKSDDYEFSKFTVVGRKMNLRDSIVRLSYFSMIERTFSTFCEILDNNDLRALSKRATVCGGGSWLMSEKVTITSSLA